MHSILVVIIYSKKEKDNLVRVRALVCGRAYARTHVWSS